MFADRVDAGRRLAEVLRSSPGTDDAVVLGIPRGGVVVAAEVARALGLPLDVVATAKVGAPGNLEYAVGAVAPDGVVLANPSAGFSQAEVERIAGPAREKVQRQLASLRGDRPAPDLRARTAIVVDDGLATGFTALAAARYLHRTGAIRVVLAVPVASSSAFALLEPEVEELVAVEVPPFFSAVGEFYAHFGQTEDSEVRALLGEFSAGNSR